MIKENIVFDFVIRFWWVFAIIAFLVIVSLFIPKKKDNFISINQIKGIIKK
jgi:hypothetical protein